MNQAFMSNAVKGAIAGAIGVWVMDKVDWSMFRRESNETRQKTEQARPDGLDPAHVVANRAAAAINKELAPAQPHPLGIATHYAIGFGPATLYAALRDKHPLVKAGRGSLFGLGLFLLQDEGINAALKLSGKPTSYPWQAHGRGLLAHIAFGVVTESVLRVWDKKQRSMLH